MNWIYFLMGFAAGAAFVLIFFYTRLLNKYRSLQEESVNKVISLRNAIGEQNMALAMRDGTISIHKATIEKQHQLITQLQNDQQHAQQV